MNSAIEAIKSGVLYNGYIICSGEIGKAADYAQDMARATSTTPYVVDEPNMEKIRSLQTSLYEDVQKGDAKIAIIYADDLSDRCQNAMLKTVEDGGEKQSVIFVTTNINVLLPTIISRCIVVYPEMESEIDILREIGTTNFLYARYSGNSLNRAKELLQDKEFVQNRSVAVKIMDTLLNKRVYVVPKADSARISEYIKYMQLFLRDALTGDIYWYFDEENSVLSYINTFTKKQIIGIIKEVNNASVRIYKKANPMVTFDSLQLAVLEVINENSNRD